MRETVLIICLVILLGLVALAFVSARLNNKAMQNIQKNAPKPEDIKAAAWDSMKGAK